MCPKGVDYNKMKKRKQSLLSPGKVATCQLCVYFIWGIHHGDEEEEEEEEQGIR